ncbi:MAG: chromosome segregation protein SMC [Elusimicrobiota bacterium]|nr:chromosome segregation protein SMC [Elusimicrobiota bacterium]
MYLKSIDIVGYKSFALKTRVDLEPGITGVIGPNGCGKSNVMESVRWCLGEMSWKSLRATTMTDVIFAGTAKRPPMSMAEVTLTFDNASSLLPVQYSEVVITRKLFRSGESQYFLNKTQCRLRDIREMFLDTGLGGDGYAIIDQGGVDAMIRAKPEERRAFFEEAAGVAKYNAKRDEALRKLEKVDMDLGRLQDSVVLIDEQVKKLDSDARKAKLYAKYKVELAAMEAIHIVEQAAAVEAELAGMQERIAPVEQVLGERRSQIAAEGAQISALQLERAGEQNRLIEANQKVAESKTEIGRLEERLNSSTQTIAGMDARAEQCRAEAETARARQAAIAPESEQVAAMLARAVAALAEAAAEAAQAQADLDALKAKADAAQALKDDRNKAVSAAQQASYEAGRELSSVESERAQAEVHVRSGLRNLERDLASATEAESRLAEARAELSAAETRLAEAKAASAAADEAVDGLRRRQASLGEDAMRLHSELANSKARSEALEEQGGQNPYWVGAQAVIDAKIPGVVGTVRGLFRCDDALKPWLEDMLGERLYAVVCEDSTAARAGVELLEAAGSGRARFLVASALPAASSERPYPPESKPLIARLQFDPAHERVLRHLMAEAYELGGKLFGDHWVFGGAPQRETPSAQLADLPALKAKVLELEVRGTTLSEERASVEAGLVEAVASARKSAEALSAASAQQHGLEALARQLESAAETHRRNVELSTGEAVRGLAEVAAAKERLVALKTRRAEADAAVEAARAEEARAAETLGAAREELAAKRSSVDGLESRRRGVEQEQAAYAASAKRLDDERGALEAAIGRLETEVESLAARKAETLASQRQMTESIEGLMGGLATHENAAKAVFDRLQELDLQLAQRSDELKKLQAEHDQAQADLHQHEVHASALRSKADLLKTRLWDEWQLTIEEAKAKHAGTVVDVEKLETLKKRIANMGNINMAAPEEYEQLAEKQRFLIDQINDLLKAKDDLMAAIAKINTATRENFRQTFTEVREHFIRLYGVLFEGGEADLILTDPENFLETGVEIMAQPPGKKLQSITLLSGGEKTLTAIALLFSFFMVKPSPFCMLDEADAALDDANIERFVSLVREFQNKTQFLIVSHNKRTMEAADVMYGVTMEEKGVSQLISVDFRGKQGPKAEPSKKRVLAQGPFAEPKGVEAVVTAEPAVEAISPAAAEAVEAVGEVLSADAAPEAPEAPGEPTDEPKLG